MALRSLVALFLALIACVHTAGCGQRTWHEKCGWNAEDYFDDPKVIALCEAIEANDLEEIDRQIEAGADINAHGKGKMTPLLWAYPDNKLDRLKRLLEHGADPNVVIESDFNVREAFGPGDSVTHMSCKTSFPGYFEAVFEHGGDPDLICSSGAFSGQTAIFTLIKGRAPDKAAKIKRLAELGADLNHVDGVGETPALLAAGYGRYDIALLLLELGADHRVYQYRSNARLIHLTLGDGERRAHGWAPEQKADYDRLVAWLVNHGESIEAARADRERWRSWSRSSGEYKEKMAAEVAARKAKEAKEKEANESDG